VSIRELVDRGYCIDLNVTYNMPRLIDLGYLMQHRSNSDRRSVKIINLMEQGLRFCVVLTDMEMRHAAALDAEPVPIEAARELLCGWGASGPTEHPVWPRDGGGRIAPAPR
jgi:hypothetical protein